MGEKNLPNHESTHWMLEEARSCGAETVGQLWTHMRKLDPNLDFEEFRRELYSLIFSRQVEVAETRLTSFPQYLRTWRFGMRVWLFVGAIVVSVFLAGILQSSFPLIVFRWIAGTFLVIIAPGYAFAYMLFPSRNRLSGLNRIALTIALSLFLVPTVALVLNYTPIGIHSAPMVALLALISALFLFLGAEGEFRLLRQTT